MILPVCRTVAISRPRLPRPDFSEHHKMPSRWVVNPVIFHDGARKPKVATIPDPGRPPEIIDGDTVIRYYRHSSSIGEMERCLSYVVGADLSALDADPEIITVLDGNDENLALTPYDKKWK